MVLLMEKFKGDDLQNYSVDLEQKTDLLIKRLRRIQAKQLERHTTEQLRAFVKQQHNRGNIGCQNFQASNIIVTKDGSSRKERTSYSSNVPSCLGQPNHNHQHSTTPTTNNKTSSLAEAKIKSPIEDVKNLSPAELVNLVKKLGNNDGKTNNNAKLTTTSLQQHLHHQYSQQQQGSSSCSTTPTQNEYDNSPDSHSPLNSLQTTSQSHPTTLTPKNQNSNCNFLPVGESLDHCINGASDGANSHDCLYYESKETERVRTIIGTLKTHLRHLEKGYDSDATESSSGGESCDENEFSNHDAYYHNQFSNSSSSSKEAFLISKRPEWKWLYDRSAIASRWTWLQAQVADLEFKIRQQNEMYRQLRASKGSIAFFCKDSSASNVNSSSNSQKPQQQITTPNVNGDSSDASMSTATPSASSLTDNSPSHSKTNLNSVNSSVTSPDNSSKTTESPPVPEGKEKPQLDSGEKEISHCARTLPLKYMRKRKLIRSFSALSGATRKIARYSTVQCSCNHYPSYVSPCVLCNGRFSYIPVIDTDCMPSYERFALLDPSYHPVLSSHNDVPLGFHFSKILKKETVQKAVNTKHSHKRRNNHSSDYPFKFGPDGKKLNRRRSQAIISSTKLRKKYDGTTKKKFSKGSGSRSLSGKRTSFRDKSDSLNASGDERTDSPSPSPLSADNSSVPIHRRRRSEQYAYDINNIVIPYSIASTTRVEKLKYKEIDTPKWRYVEKYNEPISTINLNNNNNTNNNTNTNSTTNNNNNEVCKNEVNHETDEDTSDESYAVRHFKCEIDEKKLFSTYLRNPGAGPGRGRGARARLDSNRSESGNSGHNTVNINESTQNIDVSSQDSLVTAPINFLNDNDTNGCSSVETPDPKTPLLTPTFNPSGDNFPSQGPSFVQDIVTTHGKPAKTTDRHRTSSSSKREDSVEEDNYIEVIPYEKRTFPISDAEYEEMLRV